MDPESIQAVWKAIKAGRVEEVRTLVSGRPDLLMFHYIGGATWLHQAANLGDLAMVEMLVEAGIDVNAPRECDPEGPLYDAVGHGHVEVARWLLDHGARLDVGGGARGTPLISAATGGSLAAVQLLLDRGADPHVTYGKPPKNALTHALMFNHGEIADLLRSRGVVEPELPPKKAKKTAKAAKEVNLHDAIRAHFRKHFGSVQDLTLAEIVPSSVPITINVCPPTRTRNDVILFTTGMSARPMTVPAGQEQYRYAELVMRLKPDWPLSTAALADQRNLWPIAWLRQLAAYPHDNGTWLGGPFAVIANGEPPEPLGPGTGMTSLLLLAETEKWGQMKSKSGTLVQFYCVFPLYTEERDLERRQGIADLLNRFEEQQISHIVAAERTNVALGQ